MTANSRDQRNRHERRIEEARKKKLVPEPRKKDVSLRREKGGASESHASRSTMPKRTRKPREAGLANEARPGLGTRADNADPAAVPKGPPPAVKQRRKPQATRHGYEEPRPEPREQPSDSLQHEQERSTGVSGHTGLT